jgi:drug/metabolite transporter (DMT)-like permease
MLLSSVIAYLAIRSAKKQKIEVDFQNLAMFMLPGFVYILLIGLNNISLKISLKELLILLGNGILFSWLGNFISLKALNEAPNPGYSLIIHKSYVVMTSVLSVWLFSSELTPKSILAIFMIIIFSALIIIDKKSEQTGSKRWLLYTFYAFFAWGFQALILKYLSDTGLNKLVILIYLNSIGSILILSQIIINKSKLVIDKFSLTTIGIIGIAWSGFNYFMMEGYKLAPNPGYINAVNTTSIAFVTIFSALLFKDELNIRKVIGVLGIMGSLIILFT